MSKARELADLGSVTTRLDEVGNTDGALSNRNLITNGSHIVNQRGITSVTTVVGQSTFTTDRWISYGNGQAVNISIQEVTLPDGTVVNSHKTTSTTSINGFLHPFQKVEALGKGFLRGKTVTISTWVRTNVSGQRIRICDTLSCYEIGDEIPSDGVWRYVTATHTLTSNMGIASTDHIQVHPAFGNTSLVNGSYIEFTLTQFETGDTATPFEHRSYGDELARCQRYFEKSYNVDVALGAVTDTGQFSSAANNYLSGAYLYGGTLTYKVPKRAAPSLSYWAYNGTADRWHSGIQGSSETLRVVSGIVNAGTNSFSPYMQSVGASDNVMYGQWAADAEL